MKLEIVDGNRGGLRGSANLSLLNRFVVGYDRGQSFILEETPHLESDSTLNRFARH